MQFFTIPIWEKEEYTYETGTDFIPTLTGYVLDGIRPRPAVLVIPGGGYRAVMPPEAETVAMKFVEKGYHAFVLTYSVRLGRDMKPLQLQPLKDISRAMVMLRENSEKWGIISDQICTCGFSAGGHLAGSLAVHWDIPELKEIRGMEPGKNRPDASILSYPVISSGEFAHRGSFDNLLGEDADAEALAFMSLEKQVSEKTPPVFLWHTVNDELVPVENTLMFASALQKEKVSFEVHIFPDGPHGISTSDSRWQQACGNILQSPTWELNRKLAAKEIAERTGNYSEEGVDMSQIHSVEEFCEKVSQTHTPADFGAALLAHNGKWVPLCFAWLDIMYNK